MQEFAIIGLSFLVMVGLAFLFAIVINSNLLIKMHERLGNWLYQIGCRHQYEPIKWRDVRNGDRIVAQCYVEVCKKCDKPKKNGGYLKIC